MAHVTIPDEDSFVVYASQTGVGPFVVPFAVFEKADITVLVDGTDVGQAGFSYTATSSTTGGYQTGTITLVVAAAAEDVTIYRDINPKRTTDMGVGPQSRDALNSAFDRIHAQLQDVQRDLGRSLLADIGATADSSTPGETKLLAKTALGTLIQVALATVSTTALALGDGWLERLQNPVETFPIESYYSGGDWAVALNAAAAAAEPTGGIVTFFEHQRYKFDPEPNELPAGVSTVGQANRTIIEAPTGDVPFDAFKWEGSVGTAYTLPAATTISSGAETVRLSSVSGLAAGDVVRLQKTPGGSITLGKYTQYTKIERIDIDVVTLENRVKFTFATADTYTIREINCVQGGGAQGFIFDGELNTSNRCRGVVANYCEDMFFENIGGRYMSGGNPMNGTTNGAVIALFGCVGTKGLDNLWAYRSGSGSTAAIQFREMGPTQYGRVRLGYCLGFGSGWYDCVDQQVGALLEYGSFGRAGKAQCCLGFQIGMTSTEKSRFTGFAVTEGSKGVIIASGRYGATDLQYFPVVSLYRASNVGYIEFSEPTFTYDSGHPFVISGAVSATTFNAQHTLVRVGTTGNIYSFTSVGPDETATGTILCNLARTPSFWVNDTGCEVLAMDLYFAGATNPAGDIHTGSTDNVTIVRARSEGAFTMTFAGTAGASSQGTGRAIYNVNGLSYMPGALVIAAGGLTATGQLNVNHTGAAPARFTGDNNQYPTALSNAVTSGTSGWAITVKDSGGADRTSVMQNAAGTPRLVNSHTTAWEIWMNGAKVGEFLNAGGMRFGSHDFVTAQGGIVERSFTDAQLNDITLAVNTTGKVLGLKVWNSTQRRSVSAEGATTGALWAEGGATRNTPA